MRKIELEMQRAIDSIKAGNREQWSKGNTRVERDGVDIKIYLHGHLIAHYGCLSGLVWMRDAGWQTVTTKSRLNAVADHFNVMGVYQKAWAWYFTDGSDFDYVPQQSTVYGVAA